MNSRDLSVIGLRLLAIYFVVMAFRQMIQFVSYASSYNPGNPPPAPVMWGLAVSFTIMIVISVLIFVFAEPVGDWLLPREEPESAGVTPDEFRAIIFSGVGLLIFGLSLERTCVTIMEVTERSLGSSEAYQFAARQAAWFNMLGSIVETLFGLFLFIGVKGVKKLWLSLRSWPETKESVDE